MSTYINKIWWYKPNNYTTSFTLTATFEDDEVEYPFRKSEGNWERVGEHDSRIAIIMPSEDNGNRFIVRSYDDDPFIDLNATYANATSLTSAREVTLKRIVFDKTFFDNELFFANSGEDNPWDLFDDNDLGDIYLTNITTNITLPNALSANADWYGWGLFNETVPAVELEPADSDYYKIPLSWEYGKAMQGFPEVSTTQSSASHPDLSRVTDAAAVNNTYKMVPLYNTNATEYWTPDTHDYGPQPAVTPDYLCFTANKAGATLRMMGEYSEDYTGDDFALEYSTDGETWQDWNFTKGVAEDGFIPCASDTLTFTSIGDKVYLRGNNTNGSCYSDILAGAVYYNFMFMGGEGTNTLDNEFAVTGDLQTIVKDDGTDKIHGNFSNAETALFTTYGADQEITTDYIMITSAPDLTLSKLGFLTYYNMFAGQSLLQNPANMTKFTLDDIPSLQVGDDVYPGSCFVYMYAGCSSLQVPCDFSGFVIDEISTQDDMNKLCTCLRGIYDMTLFNITINNKDVLGLPNIEKWPITFDFDGGDTFGRVEFCEMALGNSNGFSVCNVSIDKQGHGDWIPSEQTVSYHYDGITDIVPIFGSLQTSPLTLDIPCWIPTNGSAVLSCTPEIPQGYNFVKWQESSDGETWTDMTGLTDETLEATFTQTGDYYYKAVFEQTNP